MQGTRENRREQSSDDQKMRRIVDNDLREGGGRVVITHLRRDEGHAPGAVGIVVYGKVKEIAHDVVLLDIGRKRPATMSILEFKKPSGELEVTVGDVIGYVDRSESARVEELVAQVPLAQNEQISDEDKRDVEEVMGHLGPFLLRLSRDARRTMRESLLREFVGNLKPSPVDVERERLQAKALEMLFAGSDWMPAAQVAQLANVSVATVNRWKKDRRVFAVPFEGRDLYPRYAFNDHMRPLPVIAEVLEVLVDSTATSVAMWFESTSSFLSGRRPRELVREDSSLVKDAAENSLLNEQYAG